MKASASPLDQPAVARLLGIQADEFPADAKRILATRDLSFRPLATSERDEVILTILRRLEAGKMWVSGPDRRDVWEKGWSENLAQFERAGTVDALTPRFVGAQHVQRLWGDWVAPASASFEFDVFDVYRRWAFRKHLEGAQHVFEFGCGSCQHLPVVAQSLPGAQVHGLDWAAPSVEIAHQLGQRLGLPITGHLFDLFHPDTSLVLPAQSAVYTIGTMEQLGTGFEPFLQFLLAKAPRVVVHIETIRELYDPSRLGDHLAIRYDEARNYLDGYLTRLRQLESEGRLHIREARHIEFGSMYHDSYSLVVWEPVT